MNNNKPVVLKNAISAYLNNLKLKRVKSTLSIETYQQRLSDFVKFIGPNKEVSQIYLRDIEAYMAVLQDAGLDDSTIAFKLISIRGLLRFLARQKVSCLDYGAIELPKILPKNRDIPSDEEIEKLLQSCDLRKKDGLRDRMILEVLTSSGLRVAEFCSLRVDQLDLINNRSVIVGKRSKQRLVMWSKSAGEIIKKYLASRKKKSEFLIPCTTRTVERIVAECGRRVGIKVSPHALRHWKATNLLHKGVNLMAVSKFLGHSSILSTQIYTHYSDPDLERAYRGVTDDNSPLTYTPKSI